MKKYRVYIYVFLVLLSFAIAVCFIPINANKFIPLVEKQIEQDYGIKAHIEKLIFRFGPYLKLKTPIMHMMYNDGQKFGQFNNVKFYIPWSTIIKGNVAVKKVNADKVILKINSDDKYLQDLINKLSEKDYDKNPDIKLKNYSFTYNNKDLNKKYRLDGVLFDVHKIKNYKTLKVASDGMFYINDKHYITYNVAITPNIELDKSKINNLNIYDFFNQIEDLDFHSDIIADLKIHSNLNNEIMTSGLVNIDNISVLDPDKKYPKSFIYLTFLGNKIGVLSNIYTSNDNKIYAEGVINNSKKPELDIKVKTENVELSELFQKIKILVDFSKYKNIDSVTGKLSSDFSFKGDLNKLKSNGYLKISDASVSASGVKIDHINSDIDFSNNIITIANTKGYVKDSPITITGKIDKVMNIDFYMDKVSLKHLLPASFGVQNGIISIKSNITGKPDNIEHKENIQVEKFKMLKGNDLVSFDALKFDTNKDNAAYISNIFIKPQKTEFIKIPLLKLYVEPEKISIPDTNVFMPNSKLSAKADITNYNNSNIAFNFNLDGFLNSKDLSGFTNVSAIYPLKLNLYGNKLIQNIESQIQIENAGIFDEPGLINIISKLENDSLKIDELSFIPYNGVLSKNNKPNLKGTKKFVVTGIVENIKEPAFKNLRIFIPQILNITIKDTIAQLKGDIFLNGNVKKPDIVGQIQVQNLINQFLQLSMNNAVIDFNKNTANINAPNIKLADSSVNINAAVSTDFSKELLIKNVNVKSKYLNTDTLLMYKDVPVFNIIPINITDGKLYSEKVYSVLYGSPIYLSGVTSDFTLNNKILHLKNLYSEIYNGKLAGKMDFNLKSEDFKSTIQGRGISAAPIFDIITTKKETVSGVMNFDTDLNGNIASRQSLNGNIKFIVHNGHMGTLGKLEHLLYAQNVISDNMLRTSLSVVTTAITLKDTGLFKYLQGEIAMSDGIANIKMLQSQGPLMSLFIKGQYNPSTDYARLTVLGRLSDEIISGLGAFGDFSLNKLMVMLTGEENKLNIKTEDIEKLPPLPMKNTKEFRTVINGTLEKPSSVVQFNWISYSQKSFRQKEVPQGNVQLPEFLESIPY